MFKMIILAASLVAACATAPRGRMGPTEAPSARLPDSAAERVAAHKASDPKIDQEAEERRWGIEEAKQKRRDDEARQAAQKQTGGPGVDVKKVKKP